MKMNFLVKPAVFLAVMPALLTACRADFAQSMHKEVPLYSAPRASAAPEKPLKLDPAKPLTLSGLTDAFIANNPDLAAAYFRYQASLQRPSQEASPENPMLELMPEYAGGFSKFRTSISQEVPFPGKLKLRGLIASIEADETLETFNTLRNNMLAELRKMYYELLFIDRSIETTHAGIALLKDFEKTAQNKYSTGTAEQQDVLKAQVELDKLSNELISIEKERSIIAARINAVINQPPDTALGRPEDPAVEEYTGTLQGAIGIAVENRPELKQARLAIQKNRQKLELADFSYYPDFDIGAQYSEMNGSEDNEIALTFGISLPVYRNKAAAAVAEAERELSMSDYEYIAAENAIKAEVSIAYAELVTAKKLAGTYNDSILPRAQQALENARVGYQTGTVSFLDLIDSQRTLLELTLEYHFNKTEYLKQVVEIERTTASNEGRNDDIN